MRPNNNNNNNSSARVDFTGSITTMMPAAAAAGGDDDEDEKQLSFESLLLNTNDDSIITNDDDNSNSLIVESSNPANVDDANARNTRNKTRMKHSISPTRRPRTYSESMSPTNKTITFVNTTNSYDDEEGEEEEMELRSSLTPGRPLSIVREDNNTNNSHYNNVRPTTNLSPPTTSRLSNSSTSSRRPVIRNHRPLKSALKNNTSTSSPPPPPPLFHNKESTTKKSSSLSCCQKQINRFQKWWQTPSKYRGLKFVQLLCGAYIVVLSYTTIGTFGTVGGLVDPKTGYIIDINSKENTQNGVIEVNGDYRAVVAQTTFQMIALALSRLSAFTMYPGFPNGGFAPYIFGTLLVWWTLDNIYVQWYLTEKIQSSRFYVLPSGVQLTMAVSERFQSWGPGGYCYVCLPWVNQHQWHAFSLFENPILPSERQIFMQKLGDWTTQVHTMLGRETSRPVWIQGPFASPYGNADNYDNQILVAGGIGITPALSVIRQLKDTRRCNLIWATRDSHMLEFFIKHADLSHRGWNLVFYTGKEQLLGIEDVVVTSNGATIHIIRQRPKLNYVIPNIIYGIESGTSRPEQFVPDDKILAMELLQEKLAELENDPMMNSHEKLSELVNYCDELGYLFGDLISTLPNYKELTKSSLRSLQNKKDNRSVLDAILNFNSEEASASFTSGAGAANDTISSTPNDRRGMMMMGRGNGAASRRTMLNSSRNMFTNASRRRLGGGSGTSSGAGAAAGIRQRRSSTSTSSEVPSPTPTGGGVVVSGGGVGNTGRRSRASISTSTWGALAASIKVVSALKQELNSDDDNDDDIEAAAGGAGGGMEFPFKPWEFNQEAEDYVTKLGSQVRSTWGILYCGGKTPLEKALRKAARKARVQMHEESFAW
eukprot:scaffold10086_cov72-Cylindrotheca_fusiformis.AAC.1